MKIKLDPIGTCCFIKSGDILICVNKPAIEAIQKYWKILKDHHNDYICEKYNYAKGC